MSQQVQKADVLRGWPDIPPSVQGAVLAIGHFDGVHRGHQAVLRAALSVAHRVQRPSVVIVFEPNPRELASFARPVFRLTSLPKKLHLLSEVGVDDVLVVSFDATLAALDAASFAEQVLSGALKANHVVVGDDFDLGEGSQSSVASLERMGSKLGFGVTVVEQVGDHEHPYSADRVRNHLRRGEVRSAAEVLGYWWRITGVVKSGDGRGTGLGFPTVNLALHPSQEVADGIYAVRVVVDGQAYDAAGYLGKRPTFGAGVQKFEAFLFDFAGNLYGENIEVEFIEYIREDRTFESAQALADQMKRDCEKISDVLSSAPAKPSL